MFEFMNFLIYLSTMICFYALLTISLNIEYGITGLINFGQVGFYAIGAYTTALLYINGVPFPINLAIGGILAGIAGMIFSTPTAKLGVNYWAIITLGTSEIIRLVLTNEEWLTMGYHGVKIPKLLLIIPDVYYPYFFLALSGFFVIIFYASSRMLVNSPMGRILKTIRDGEKLPMSLGINIKYYKIIAMAFGSGIAGVAGGLYAHYIRYISPYVFVPTLTFLIWTMLIVGGSGNIVGSILGSTVVTGLYTSTRFIKDYIPLGAETISYLRMIFIGLLLIIILIYRKEGLLKEKSRQFNLKLTEDSVKVRNTVKESGVEPVILYRKGSRIGGAFRVGKNFIVRGVKRLVKLFRKRVMRA